MNVVAIYSIELPREIYAMENVCVIYFCHLDKVKEIMHTTIFPPPELCILGLQYENDNKKILGYQTKL